MFFLQVLKKIVRTKFFLTKAGSNDRGTIPERLDSNVAASQFNNRGRGPLGLGDDTGLTILESH
jgi:hypothetical protein